MTYYWLCELYTEKKSLSLMKGDIASSNAFGHSSWGRWPHPDIATSLCTSNAQEKLKIKMETGKKKSLLRSTPPYYQAWILTEFTNLEAIAWQYFIETSESSAPAMTNIGMSFTACSNKSAFFAERIVSDDNLPISWSASSHPSTYSGA